MTEAFWIMEPGDVVKLPRDSADATVGVVVGFPAPSLFPPVSTYVLGIRPDDRFGGVSGAFLYQAFELELLGHVEPSSGESFSRAGRRWCEENKIYESQRSA